MKLRDYQEECLKAIDQKHSEGIHRQMVVLPTGSGKTVIFSELIKRKKLKTLVIAHRIELIDQAREKLRVIAPEIESGIFCGDQKYHDKQVTIASIQSASNSLDLLKTEGYQLLIIDEAHHAAAKTYRRMIHELGFNEKGLMLGFTATPMRGDRTRLDDIFQKIVFNASTRNLVKKGYLVQPKGIHIKVGIDLRKIKKKMGEFDQESLKEAMQTDEAMAVVMAAVKKYASNRQCIVFGVDIAHCENLMLAIQMLGFTCQTVHSKLSLAERRQTLRYFETGKLQFVTNPMILTEGFDCPRADCMINAAPTMNNSLYTQKAGRVLRISPNKEDALLIDFGRNGRKNDLCTAITLMGGDLPFKTVSDREELELEIPKPKIPEIPLDSEETSYDPLNPKLKQGHQVAGECDAANNSDASQVTEKKINDLDAWPTEDLYISDKQISFMQKLAKSTDTPLPRKKDLEEMGLKFASEVIDYLLQKKRRIETEESLTERQARFLQMLSARYEINMGDQDIYDLTKMQAKSIIGRYKQSLPRIHSWN